MRSKSCRPSSPTSVEIAPEWLLPSSSSIRTDSRFPHKLLGDLMKAGRVELFINVMWCELDWEQRRAEANERTTENVSDR